MARYKLSLIKSKLVSMFVVFCLIRGYNAQWNFQDSDQFRSFQQQQQLPTTTMTSGISATSTVAPEAPQIVFINNRPTIVPPIRFMAVTTASPSFRQCLSQCPTTSEYNPICASNRELYGNEQKFMCALSCGADIQIVRRGSCAGLFPMMRG